MRKKTTVPVSFLIGTKKANESMLMSPENTYIQLAALAGLVLRFPVAVEVEFHFHAVLFLVPQRAFYSFSDVLASVLSVDKTDCARSAHNFWRGIFHQNFDQ